MGHKRACGGMNRAKRPAPPRSKSDRSKSGRNPTPPKKVDISGRAAALELLGDVFKAGLPISDASACLADIKPAARAEALRLARMVLRHRSNLDRIIDPILRNRPANHVRRILWLMLVEVQIFKTPDHAVVDAYVRLAKADRATGGKAAPLVNAMGRQFVELDADVLSSKKAPKLPKELRGKLIGAYGQARVDKMEDLFRQTPPIDLIFKDPQPDARPEGESLGKGHLRIGAGGKLSALSGFDTGQWWVQDFAASLPAQIFANMKKGDILDLCAAPGGKTMQLASYGHQVDALDISEGRLTRVESNLKRTGLTANLIAEDALEWDAPKLYDGILLDAPCSATGTIRRHPELPHLRETLEVKPLLEIQRKLAARAVTWLKSGGIMVIATCSLLPAEGEKLAEWVLENCEGLEPYPITLAPDIAAKITQDQSNQIRLTPDQFFDEGGVDGFFYCAFKKAS